jgi:carbon monoxide dehydrogenase subunit G
MWESKNLGSTTEATVELHGTPDEIYKVITDYAKWDALFTDVKNVKVKSGGRDDGVVKFTSKSLMGHTITVRFKNTAGKVIVFKLTDGPHGAVSTGVFTLTSTGERTTRIDAKFYMDVTGVMGWFIDDSTIKALRQLKLQRDLLDLAKRFNK